MFVCWTCLYTTCLNEYAGNCYCVRVCVCAEYDDVYGISDESHLWCWLNPIKNHRHHRIRMHQYPQVIIVLLNGMLFIIKWAAKIVNAIVWQLFAILRQIVYCSSKIAKPLWNFHFTSYYTIFMASFACVCVCVLISGHWASQTPLFVHWNSLFADHIPFVHTIK